MNYGEGEKSKKTQPSVNLNYPETVDYNANRNPHLRPPVAHNNLAPLAALFYERKFWKEGLYESFILGEQNLIDLWGSPSAYGKVNFKGYPIILNEYFLKGFESNQIEEVLGLNFVVDAFDDFSTYLARQAQKPLHHTVKGANSLFSPLRPDQSWTSARVEYGDHMGRMFDFFANEFAQAHLDEIKDFNTFVNLLLEFLVGVSSSTPITFSGWYSSQQAPFSCTGLSVHLQGPPADDDAAKYEVGLQDPNYEFYRKSAGKFGFFIDKNWPTRLIANLNHPYMLRKQRLNGFFGNEKSNLQNIFGVGYSLAHRQDIGLLQSMFAGYYNSFITRYPTLTIRKSFKCMRTDQARFKTVNVDLPPLDAMDENGLLKNNSSYTKNYGDLFWIKVYTYLKIYERGNTMSLKNLDKFVVRYYDYWRLRGIGPTVDKIYQDLTSIPQFNYNVM